MGDEGGKKVLDCKASDNEYLHKDFHGALCYAIKYLDENFGAKGTRRYLQQLGETYFAPLSEAMKTRGLAALEDHWRKVFTLEGGKFELRYDGDVLVLTVRECPGVAHLKRIGKFYTPRFCETTVTVNETICRRAGYECSCEYESGAGRCVQRFWKPRE